MLAASCLLLSCAMALLVASRFGATRATPAESDALPPLEQQLASLTAGRTDQLELGAQVLDRATLAEIVQRAPGRLRALRARRTDLTDRDLDLLAGQTALEELVLRGFSSRHGDWLEGLPAARIVNLPDAPLSDAWLALAARHSRLELLRVGADSVTDAGLEQLAGSKSLRHLHLIRPDVSLEGLRAVALTPSLESLYVDNLDLETNEFEQLAAAFPGLHLHLNQRHVDNTPAD